MEDIISKSLNIDPLEGEILQTPKPLVAASTDNVDRDYKYARENFYNVIERGTDALEQMLDVAKASEHPRAYEVVSTIMKTLTDANKELVDLSTKNAEKNAKSDDQSPNTVNNNLFVGSTADLQQMLKDLKDGSD